MTKIKHFILALAALILLAHHLVAHRHDSQNTAAAVVEDSGATSRGIADMLRLLFESDPGFNSPDVFTSAQDNFRADVHVVAAILILFNCLLFAQEHSVRPGFSYEEPLDEALVVLPLFSRPPPIV